MTVPFSAFRQLSPPGIPRAFARKAHWLAQSSTSIQVGLPAPWPARVSMRMSTGFAQAWAYWSAAANLKLCQGTTRSSWSAVVTSVGG